MLVDGPRGIPAKEVTVNVEVSKELKTSFVFDTGTGDLLINAAYNGNLGNISINGNLKLMTILENEARKTEGVWDDAAISALKAFLTTIGDSTIKDGRLTQNAPN
jgi:hypothetical protein